MESYPRPTVYKETANYLHPRITDAYYTELDDRAAADHVSTYTPEVWWEEQSTEFIDSVVKSIQEEAVSTSEYRMVILSECIETHNDVLNVESKPFADITTGIRLSMRRGLTGRVVLHQELQQKGLVCLNSAITSAYNGCDLPLMLSDRLCSNQRPFMCHGGVYAYIYFDEACTVQDYIEDDIRHIHVF